MKRLSGREKVIGVAEENSQQDEESLTKAQETLEALVGIAGSIEKVEAQGVTNISSAAS
ncbi:hypothetical protein [Salinibacter altiplanensis]|uniref:hypothetical protein n=1 Tax=Salinibacter altiplanensis TaxID=1803181 RepID=UPI00131A574C|nr:hypothetical protein [Salinibacter altiplanensis]